MEPGFQPGLSVLKPIYFEYWFTVTLHMSGGIHRISMDVFYYGQKKQLDDIWNYFGMEKSIIWNLKKKYFDVKMTPINDGKQGKWGERQG